MKISLHERITWQCKSDAGLYLSHIVNHSVILTGAKSKVLQSRGCVLVAICCLNTKVFWFFRHFFSGNPPLYKLLAHVHTHTHRAPNSDSALLTFTHTNMFLHAHTQSYTNTFLFIWIHRTTKCLTKVVHGWNAKKTCFLFWNIQNWVNK